MDSVYEKDRIGGVRHDDMSICDLRFGIGDLIFFLWVLCTSYKKEF